MSCCDGTPNSTTPSVAPCECPAAGFCARHKITKDAHYYRLCRRDNYRAAWDRGQGPGQWRSGADVVRNRPALTVGLGDVVAFLIRVVTFGRVKMCSACQGRKAWLNRWFPLWPMRWPGGRR